jgi:predicted permease
VVSYEVWQNDLGGDKNILNKPIRLEGRTYTLIGVMPAGFRFPIGVRNAIYTPLHLDESWMKGRGNHWLQSVGRLKDGVSIAQAQADLAHVFANLGRSYPDTDQGRSVHLTTLMESVTGDNRGPLWTLLAASLAVLAIGCVNVAGLLLARGVEREREMAMRAAIGAGRVQLVRQMLTEGIVLALLGAAGGVLLSWTALSLMRAFLIKALSRGADIHLNATVLAVAVALAVAASLAASLFPALRLSGIDPNRVLKAGGNAGTARGQYRLRSSFVVTQVALTLVLLVVAGLLIRVVTRYQHTDLGFEPSHILSVKLNPAAARYQGRDIVANFYRPLLDRVQHIPGVRAVGLINLLPISEYGSNSDIHIAGQPPYPTNQEMLAEDRFVSTGYYDVFGIQLDRGRALTPSLDRPENAAPTVVVNEAFVKKFIPGNLDPTTQRIDDSDKPEKYTRIVGVTNNIRQNIYEPPLAEQDWLIEELPAEMQSLLSHMSLVIRFDGDASALTPALRAVLHETDPTVPLQTPETMTETLSDVLAFERMEGWLFGIFAALALVLAVIGLYGLMSHEVAQSSRDIGIRMALGASRPRILASVLQRVTWMLGAGVAAGFVLTIGARKLIGMVIYFDAPKEAGGFLSVALVLCAAGFLAALAPAIRAASIEPMQALRNE